MISAKSGFHTILESVMLLALSLVLLLSVSPFTGKLFDGQITMKWIGMGISICATVLISQILFCIHDDEKIDLISPKIIYVPFLIIGLVVATHSLLQIIGIVLVQSNNGFRIMAGFDNPAGVASALVVSLPFILALLDMVKDNRIKYVAMSVVSCTVLMLLAIARSRVGILATGMVMVLFVMHTIKGIKARRIVAVAMAILIIVAVVYLSFYKRGSNSGRALILGVCWDMFKDAPLFGHGLHGFRSQYMLYQEEYLEQCTSKMLPMLADNTTHPLNEYALVAVNFGLLGMSVLLTGIILTLRHYIKNPDAESFVGITVLAGIGVLSLFSYPFRYPLTLVGLLCALILVFKDVLSSLSRKVKKAMRIVVSILSALALVLIVLWAQWQIEWGQLSTTEDANKNTKEILEGYSVLYDKLKGDPYFLYNYAYVLSDYGDCKSADRMARESFSLMSNYDTALFIADNAKECGDAEAAEEYYWLASKMCPVRFMPLYGLFCLYKDMDRIDDMFEIGQVILSKPVKISSIEIRTIRYFVKQTLMYL